MKRKGEDIPNSYSSKVQKCETINFGPSFRRRLKTDDAIPALQEFIRYNKYHNIVDEYVNAGGSVKELVNLLKQFNAKNNFDIANTIFSAIHYVVLRVVSDLLLQQEVTETSCTELLCTYQTCMQNMLNDSSSPVKYRKTILKLFTAMVTLSGNLAKTILISFPFSPKLLKKLINPSSSKTSIKLRTCFIHFLLSFLMDNNHILIIELLQKKGLLISIIPGLANDPPELIIFVLNILRLKIVENIRIPKTLKLNTFNTTILRALFNLYEIKKSKSSEIMKENIINGMTDETNSVRDAVHELFLLLCTSSKKGILFRQQQNPVNKTSNQIILNLLENIKEPFEDELKWNLISEILKVCPEFVKNVLSKIEVYLQPQISNYWVKSIDFVIQIIENQELTWEGEGGDTFNRIISVFFPPTLQKFFSRITDDLVHEHPVIRFKIIQLLSTILRNISQLVDKFKKHNETSNLQDQIFPFLNKIVIPVNMLKKAWEIGVNFATESNIDEITNNVDISDFTVNQYHLILADLLILYKRLIPMCFNELIISGGLNFENIQNFTNSVELKFKLAQLIFLIYNPEPNKAEFNYMMKLFLESYTSSNDYESYTVIENVLRSTSFAGGCENEITVWLFSFKKIDSSANEIIDIFIDALRFSWRKSKTFLNPLTTSSQKYFLNENYNEEGENIDEWESLFTVDNAISAVSKPAVKLSPVVFEFVHILKSNERKNSLLSEQCVRDFISTVFVHLLHLQCSVEPLNDLLNDIKNECVESKVVEFISYWNKKSTSTYPTYPLELEENISNAYSCVINEFSSNEELQFINTINEMEATLIWNLCTFYMVHLDQMDLINNVQKRNNISEILKQLLTKMSEEKAVLCLELLLTNRLIIDRFIFQKNERKSSLPNIIIDVVLNSESYSNLNAQKYSNLVFPYRKKFLMWILKEKKQEHYLKINSEDMPIKNIVKFVSLYNQTVIQVLQLLISLPVKFYIDETHSCETEWTMLISCLLEVATDNLEKPLSIEIFTLLITRLNEIYKTNVSIEGLENNIINYIRVFPHLIHHIPEDLIEELCRSSNPSIYNLAAYLIVYRGLKTDILQEQILKNIKKIKIEPLLEVLKRIQRFTSIDERIFQRLQKLYLRDFTALLNTDESLWLKDDYIIWTKQIISKLDHSSCMKVCLKMKTSFADLELNKNKCEIMKIIFEKSSEISSYVEFLIEKFNQLSLKNKDVIFLCNAISNTGSEIDYLSNLLCLPLWQDFVKSSLKISLQTDNPVIMRTFKVVCKKVLNENVPDESRLIFQMTISHSAFVGRMLNNSELKIELIELLLFLTRVNPSVMSSNHVPLLFAAYKATLAASDQILLKLLHWYEDNGIRFSDCRPYLWGDAAASHYSIKTDISVSLSRQPLPNQVLELFEINIVKNTIKYFPLNRPLWPNDCLCDVNDMVYDLSFVLPLLSHLLAPESRISIQKFTRSGALCLILISLSCEDKAVRNAGVHCLQRFQTHLFSREKEVQIWNQFINALQNSLIALHSDDENKPPRVSCLVTAFFANMSLIISEPLHSLYSPILNFLLAKPAFDLNTIPNFFMLFYSSDLKHMDHQRWILKIIRDGMRYNTDWILAQNSFLLKFLLQNYLTTVSNGSAEVLILHILAKALEMDKCRLFLITKSSLLKWIYEVVSKFTKKNLSSLPLLVKILKLSINAKNSEYILNTLVLLLRKVVDLNIDRSVLEELLETVSKTCSLSSKTLSGNDINVIFKLVGALLDSRYRKLLENALKFKSILFFDEYCDNAVEKYVFQILQQFIIHSQ